MERLIPRMFHRRLALLLGGAVFATVALGARLYHLTVVTGAERRAEAEARLDRTELLATSRGAIRDRNGRVLAHDAPSVDIAVDYPVISGDWVIQQSFKAAEKAHGDRWSSLSPSQQVEAYKAYSEPYQRQVNRLWEELIRVGGITRAELDERLDQIKREVQLMAEQTWAASYRSTKQRAREAGQSEEAVPFGTFPIREQRIAHPILKNVSEGVAFHFRQMQDELPGLQIVDSHYRAYPGRAMRVEIDRSRFPEPLASDTPLLVDVKGVADHLTGRMRNEVWASDLERRPFRRIDPSGNVIVDRGGYRTGDSVGNVGLEYIYEDWLRGERGVNVHHRNTNEREVTPPTPGRDLQISIDSRLQARIQAVMSPEAGLMRVQQFHAGWNETDPKPTQLPLGTPMNGAAVVLDVDSSEVLAMVTMPTLAMADAEDDTPTFNRAIEVPYPPGSIIKPLILAGAVRSGVHSLDRRIDCTGHYFPNWKSFARCWIYRERYHFTTHNAQFGGPLTAQQAIAVSCNCYFYALADRMGADRLCDWLQSIGIGRFLDTGLLHQKTIVDQETNELREVTLGEIRGDLPTGPDGQALDSVDVFQEVSMGIGMGPISWTPLHAANAYATLARHGYVRDATLIKQGPEDALRDHSGRDLQISPSVLDEIMRGLHDSVHATYGTGNRISYADGTSEPIINAPGVDVWAKTGTVTVVVARKNAPKSLRNGYQSDSETDESKMAASGEDSRVVKLDHAWFVGLVGEKGAARPKFAIAVLVEYGGSGGRVAGPVANQIIHALRAEGYLD